MTDHASNTDREQGDVVSETESAVEVETTSETSSTGSDVESNVSVAGTEASASSAAEDAVENDSDDDSDDDLVEEGEIAGDYLEQLLDVLDFDGDIDLDVEGDRAIVSIDGGRDLSKLVGRKGEVLDALQELTRLAVQQSTGERSRLMLDIAGWRADRRSDLTEQGKEAARKVLESGEREVLAPMTPFERKIVHDAVAGIHGVSSESEGAEPSRRVVVIKA